MEYDSYVDVPSRVLLIREDNGRLFLQSPIARNWKVAVGLLAVVALLSAFLHQFSAVATAIVPTDLPGLEILDKHPWLDVLLDLLLPSPTWELNVIVFALVAIAVALVGHRVLTIADNTGITIRHSMYGLEYWEVAIPRAAILSFELKVNARWGNDDVLYALVVNCATPPGIRSRGHEIAARRYKGETGWHEWMASDLPEDIADYVLSRVRTACACPER